MATPEAAVATKASVLVYYLFSTTVYSSTFILAFILSFSFIFATDGTAAHSDTRPKIQASRAPKSSLGRRKRPIILSKSSTGIWVRAEKCEKSTQSTSRNLYSGVNEPVRAEKCEVGRSCSAGDPINPAPCLADSDGISGLLHLVLFLKGYSTARLPSAGHLAQGCSAAN